MDWRRLSRAAVPVATAALLGNAFVGRRSMEWFASLRRPKIQLQMPGFYAVGGIYYLLMLVVVHRAIASGDKDSYRRAMVVLAGNELWNLLFFGRRSTRAGFVGILAFTVPLLRLQASVATDPVSTLALSPYTLWVIGYDIPWTYQLWRLNR
ncbi:MAG TPA: TspO/MBR family protein [Jiangellaceae bacterium]